MVSVSLQGLLSSSRASYARSLFTQERNTVRCTDSQKGCRDLEEKDGAALVTDDAGRLGSCNSVGSNVLSVRSFYIHSTR
jgi:hypothetical protein